MSTEKIGYVARTMQGPGTFSIVERITVIGLGIVVGTTKTKAEPDRTVVIRVRFVSR